MVLALVLLPAAAPACLNGRARRRHRAQLALPARSSRSVKVAAFVVVMLVVGRRVIPWLLHYVAHTGSRELFRLAVLAIALGVAFGAAMLFGVSFALGAFFAGMILSESELSQRAAEETLPLRDAFAVLFFVSVGMLFDPHDPRRASRCRARDAARSSSSASRSPPSPIVRLFGYPTRTALTISASLAQIGEFSFILAGLGVSPRAAAGARARPDPRRRHHLDRAQSAAVRLPRPLSRANEAPPSPQPEAAARPRRRPQPARAHPATAGRPRRAGRLRQGRQLRRRRAGPAEDARCW